MENYSTMEVEISSSIVATWKHETSNFSNDSRVATEWVWFRIESVEHLVGWKESSSIVEVWISSSGVATWKHETSNFSQNSREAVEWVWFQTKSVEDSQTQITVLISVHLLIMVLSTDVDKILYDSTCDSPFIIIMNKGLQWRLVLLSNKPNIHAPPEVDCTWLKDKPFSIGLQNNVTGLFREI